MYFESISVGTRRSIFDIFYFFVKRQGLTGQLLTILKTRHVVEDKVQADEDKIETSIEAN